MSLPRIARAWRRGPRVFAAALLAVALAGCGPLREFIAPTAPAVTGEWAALLAAVREYERTIGFTVTGNFAGPSQAQQSYAFCGHASPLTLPWSYEDPAIRWWRTDDEAECRALAPDADMFFRRLEAKGEADTPVTGAMLAGRIDRFIYLVIHEDCHDQFALPLGLEEALCDFITHQAMIAFAERRYPPLSREQRSIRRYAETQAAQARATIQWYARIEALYARYARGEISAPALLAERAVLFARAEQPLGFAANEMNNVSLANSMTYSRHYPQFEALFDAQGRDLARAVAFFRQADATRPAAETVRRQLGIADGGSVEFLRAYEKTLIDAFRAAAAGGARAQAALPMTPLTTGATP
jgi:hypothetical protein